jgi:hypothetical protein
VNGDRHDGEFLAPQHHDGMVGPAVGLGGECRQEFRVAWMTKARLIQNVLRNRVRDHSRGRTAPDEPHRRLDRFRDRAGIGRIRFSGLG